MSNNTIHLNEINNFKGDFSKGKKILYGCELKTHEININIC